MAGSRTKRGGDSRAKGEGVTRAKRDPDPSRGPRAAAASRPAPRRREPGRWLPFAAAGAALAALAWSMRGFVPGVPVADDYSFLARLAFERPLDPWSSMGATYYWRPLSRQAWFSAIGPATLATPALVALLHAAVLAATFALLYRTARRGFGRVAATAIALIPIVSLPARALVAWPSGIQHLLAAALVALVVHESAAGRWITAGVAAGAAVLSHESGVLGLIALPLVAALRRRAGRGAAREVALAASLAIAIGAAWLFGYRTALAHGVAMPPGAPAEGLARLPDLLRRALAAALNLEDQEPMRAWALGIGYACVAAVAALRLADRDARAAVAARSVVAAVLVAAFLLAVAPLAQLLPDWNDWRAWTPTLALGAGVVVALAALDPRLAAAWVGIKLIAVLLAPPAEARVTKEPPATGSHMSYLRIARLQRIVDSSRRALHATRPDLPPGAAVRYWNLPRLAEVGFQDAAALRVWYGDSTLTWSKFGGIAGIAAPPDVIVEFAEASASPASVIEQAAADGFVRGGQAFQDGRFVDADTLFATAIASTATRGPLYTTLLTNRARSRLALADLNGAAYFNDLARRAGGDSPDYWAIETRILASAGMREQAIEALRRLLAMEPQNPEAREIAEKMGL